MRNYFLLLSFFSIVFTASCQDSKLQNDEVYIVIQPEIELNKATDFDIYFRERPDKGSLSMDSIQNAILDLDVIADNEWLISTYNIDEHGKKVPYYCFSNDITGRKLGDMVIPEVTVKIKGKIYKSKPFVVKVVDNIDVNDKSVLLELLSDKEVYSLKDTIRLRLNDYSKISNIHYRPAHKKAITEEDIKNVLRFTIKMEDYVGNKNLERYLLDNFTVLGFDWNPLQANAQLVKKDGEVYLKTFVFEYSFLPKKIGNFEIEPSEFDCAINKNNSDLNDLKPNGDGTYSIESKNRIVRYVKSNKVNFTVQ